jgi:hypothetical protein
MIKLNDPVSKQGVSDQLHCPVIQSLHPASTWQTSHAVQLKKS